jgi:GNAT superfamily N-acetyltransferase
MTPSSSVAVTDIALARRLERAEGTSNAAFVESRAAQQPDVSATWIDVHGAMAMFDGIGSPLTQTFCLGMFEPLDAEQLHTIETFFAERGADTFHEVCPLSDPNALVLLPDRGYRPIEQSAVLWQPLPANLTERHHDAAPRARRIDPDEVLTWADYSARGWGAAPELAEFMRNFGAVTGSARGTSCFVAEIDGEIVGTAALNMHDGVALLAGASTLPEFRGRGAQAVLLRARLAFAHTMGCDIAMMAALPGSTSQTNAEKQGFRIAYTRTKWHRGLATQAADRAASQP